MTLPDRMSRQDGDLLGAAALVIAVQALEAPIGATRPVIELCNVATGYLMKGDPARAAGLYRLVLTLAPMLAVAYQNLAAILLEQGRPDAFATLRQRAYRLQRVYIDRLGDPPHRVLVLCSGQASANVPYKTLLPTLTFCRIQYAIDFADTAEDDRLPAFDVAFNAIGEPDVAVPLLARLEHFAARCGRPLLNRPAAVARTQRHHLAALLADVADVVVAPCLRFEGPPASPGEWSERRALLVPLLPVLVRPAGSHGGQGLQRCSTEADLDDTLAGFAMPHYVTAFHDTQSADGHYRKYRIIFVDRVPYPYHLAISTHWMVHYFSADMEAHPWKLAEERCFLDDPARALGERGSAAIAAIGQRLDLDYAGIDFALLADGRAFVFEANATMLVHRERDDGPLAAKNPAVQRIVDAFAQRLSGAAGEGAPP